MLAEQMLNLLSAGADEIQAALLATKFVTPGTKGCLSGR
jgi:hypothetical protein